MWFHYLSSKQTSKLMKHYISSSRIGTFNSEHRSPETLYVDQKSIFSNYLHNVASRGNPTKVGGADSGQGEGVGGGRGEGWGIYDHLYNFSERKARLRKAQVHVHKRNEFYLFYSVPGSVRL